MVQQQPEQRDKKAKVISKGQASRQQSGGIWPRGKPGRLDSDPCTLVESILDIRSEETTRIGLSLSGQVRCTVGWK